jgi:hypothetical protein
LVRLWLWLWLGCGLWLLNYWFWLRCRLGLGREGVREGSSGDRFREGLGLDWLG